LIGNERILMVDDETEVLEIHSHLLEYFGYRVDTLDSPHAALEFIRNNKESIDLVLIDQKMPGMTGAGSQNPCLLPGPAAHPLLGLSRRNNRLFRISGRDSQTGNGNAARPNRPQGDGRNTNNHAQTIAISNFREQTCPAEILAN